MSPSLKPVIDIRFIYNYEVYYAFFHNADQILDLYSKNPKWTKCNTVYDKYRQQGTDEAKAVVQQVMMAFEAWRYIIYKMSGAFCTKEKGIIEAHKLITEKLKWNRLPTKIPKEKYRIQRAPRRISIKNVKITSKNLDKYTKKLQKIQQQRYKRQQQQEQRKKNIQKQQQKQRQKQRKKTKTQKKKKEKHKKSDKVEMDEGIHIYIIYEIK